MSREEIMFKRFKNNNGRIGLVLTEPIIPLSFDPQLECCYLDDKEIFTKYYSEIKEALIDSSQKEKKNDIFYAIKIYNKYNRDIPYQWNNKLSEVVRNNSQKY